MRRLLKYINPPKKPKLILSLDGGGVRAIAEVVFLKQLEIASGKKIFDLFDFFIGTSAGGINALHFAGRGSDCFELEDVRGLADISFELWCCLAREQLYPFRSVLRLSPMLDTRLECVK